MKQHHSAGVVQSPESTHASTVIQAIRTIEDTNGPIQRGHLTDQSWATMCALMGDPTSVLEALNGPDSEYWRQAIQTELQSLIDLDVYEEIERADVRKDKKVLLSKIVLKYKIFEKRFKARLVVLGFMQLGVHAARRRCWRNVCTCGKIHHLQDTHGHRLRTRP